MQWHKPAAVETQVRRGTTAQDRLRFGCIVFLFVWMAGQESLKEHALSVQRKTQDDSPFKCSNCTLIIVQVPCYFWHKQKKKKKIPSIS